MVSDYGRDLDDMIVIRIEARHLQIYPDQIPGVLAHARSLLFNRSRSVSNATECSTKSRRIASRGNIHPIFHRRVADKYGSVSVALPTPPQLCSCPRHEVPQQFAGRIGLPAHQRAAAYTVDKANVSITDAVVSAALLLGWTLGGGINFLTFSGLSSIGLNRGAGLR